MTRPSGEDEVTDTLWSLHDRETDPLLRSQLREAVARLTEQARKKLERRND
jgi:hypothetical protein